MEIEAERKVENVCESLGHEPMMNDTHSSMNGSMTWVELKIVYMAARTIADYMEIIYSYANYSWHLWNMVLLTPPIK